MILIYKDFIKKNISNLKIEHLKHFALQKQIPYTEEELNTVYHFILYYYQDLLEGNSKVFEVIKNKISPRLYQDLIHLYIEYKNQYLS